MADIKYWIWFAMAAGNNREDANHLLKEADNNPEIIYNMTKDHFEKAGLKKPELLSALCNKELGAALRELHIANKFNVKIISCDMNEYPEDLQNIHDRPYIIYKRGTLRGNYEDKLKIAIVGSRRASNYGLTVAYELAYELAKRGAVIISGMATGIDSQAHLGALEAGGKTIAVLGCGVNIVYPKDNADLMVNIMKNGEVISEYPFDTQPLKWNFPQRNRIMSGIADGVIVVEAEEISGTSITAKLALEQGKELFAVPGNITSPNSVGTNNLIKTAAVPVTCVDDVFAQFPRFKQEPSEQLQEPSLGITEGVQQEDEEQMPEQVIMELLRVDALSADEISEKTGLPLPQISSLLSIMEISGLLTALPGHKYIKTSKLK